jgi:hypothetical protein
MKRLFLVLTLAVLSAPPISADNLARKFVHSVSHHKETFVRSGILTAYISVDVWSTNRCQRISAYCIETNPVLGQHPSPQATWGYALGIDGVLIALDAVAAHYAPSRLGRQIPWAWTIPIAAYETVNVRSNIEVTGRLENLNQILNRPTHRPGNLEWRNR